MVYAMLCEPLVADLVFIQSCSLYVVAQNTRPLFGGTPQRLDFFLCSYREMSTGLHVHGFQTNTEQRPA